MEWGVHPMLKPSALLLLFPRVRVQRTASICLHTRRKVIVLRGQGTGMWACGETDWAAAKPVHLLQGTVLPTMKSGSTRVHGVKEGR